MPPSSSVARVTDTADVLAELAALEDPKIREVNERHGDDHGVNLTKLRAVAKRLKTQQELKIGERLEVLKDYPTPPGCTSPYAPAWINEIVRRQEAAS